MTNRNLLKILFVEDTLSDVDLAVLELKKEKLKFDYTAVYTRSGLLKALKDFKPDLIISDYSMPQFNGLQAISLIKKFSPEIPVILFTGSINEETAVECLKAGAVDYVIKEHMKRLPFAVKEAMEQVSKQKEKKASELLLKESEEKLQSIFSAAPVGIGYIVDRVLIEINDAFCSITGYNRRELIGKSMEFLYPTKDEYEFIGREYRKITEKSKWSVETRIKCKSGKILNVIMNGSPLNKNDLSKGFTFTILDITARKQSEILLGESEERFRSLYNDAFSGLYRTNSKGEILLANRALIKMLGFQSFEELVARNLNDKGYEPSYLRQQFIDQIEKEGEVNNLESIWICHNGKEIFVRENAKAIYDSDGKILYYDGSVEDITERRKSENQQALVFLSLPLLIYYSETTNNYAATWISENVNRVTGFNRDVFLEKKNFWSGRLHPDDRDRVVRAFNELQESEKGEIEYRWQCANGEYHWFLDSYNSFKKNLQGKIEFIGVWIDITERKKVEEALQESEERYRMIVETAHDIVWMLDTQGCFIFINKRAEKITGHKISDWIGKSFVSLVHPEDLARVQEIFLATLRGKTQSFEVRIFSNTGEIIILSVNSVPISHGGIVTSTASFGRDITARKQTEEALKSSVSLLNASLESTADGILIVDGKGGIIKWNQKFSDMWGLSDELLNQHDDNAAINNILDKLIAPDEFLTTVKDLYETPEKSSLDELRFKDGRIFERYSQPQKIDKIVVGRVWSFRDVTELVKTADHMKLAKEKAEASDKLKTTFLNNISHEVRTPLNGILGFAEIISQTNLSDVDKKDSLSMLHESSDRLLNTITNYMDISLITSGSLSVYNKDFPPGQILKKMFDFYESMSANKNLKLILDLPEHSDDISVNSDPELIRKIISHLINNAVKFTEKGSIRYGYSINESNIEFYVKDTGIGIGKDSLDNIFDRFVKEDRGPLRITEGSGLGLSIAKGMIERIGGIIRVESELGTGSCFSFSIPLINTPDSSKFYPSDRVPGTFQKNILILVAEDDDTNFFYIKAILTREIQATILHAVNGRQAIDLYKANPGIHLILMDIKMPDVDGFEATREIKKLNPDIPIIAITAYAMLGDEDKILSAGCDGYLSKPISKKSLLEKIGEFMIS